MPSFIHGAQTDRLRDEANIPPTRPSDDRDDPSERAARTNSGASERYFSVRWMVERERARDASDDCGSAFAVIPVGKLSVTLVSALDKSLGDIAG